MTTTTWTTTAAVPPAAWAALVADMEKLLRLTAAGGATVAGPAGTDQPTLSTERIAFVVTTPGGAPLTVTMTRAAGTGEVVTNAPHTDGLVLVALHRAAKAWGQLLTWTSDAGTTARAVAEGLQEQLYAPDDRAVDGTSAPHPNSRLVDVVMRVQLAAGLGHTTELELLDALIGELTAERAGLALALAMTAPLAPAPEPEPEPAPTEDTPTTPAQTAPPGITPQVWVGDPPPQVEARLARAHHRGRTQ